MALPNASTSNPDKRYQSTVIGAPRSIRRSLQPEVPQVYRSANASDEPVPPIPGTLKIVVGPASTNQRIWNLPKALLAQHSWTLQDIITKSPTASEIQLPTIHPNAFADFTLFMNSNMYSPNTQVTGYRSLRAHADACLLGAKLEADDFWEAGMRQLYRLFEPLARSTRSDAKQSLIRASDIAYICANATAANLSNNVIIGSGSIESNNTSRESSPDPPSRARNMPASRESSPTLPRGEDYSSYAVGGMANLQKLFFDALASHWTQRDVTYIGAHDSPRGGGFNRNDVPGDSTTWRELCDTYPHFRKHMARTGNKNNAWRGRLLRDILVYLDPIGVEEQEEEEDSERNSSGSSVTLHVENVDKIMKEVDEEVEPGTETATSPSKLTIKLRGLRRIDSGERTETGEEASENVSMESEERVQVGVNEVEEDAAEDEAIQAEEMAEGMDAGIEQEDTFAGC